MFLTGSKPKQNFTFLFTFGWVQEFQTVVLFSDKGTVWNKSSMLNNNIRIPAHLVGIKTGCLWEYLGTARLRIQRPWVWYPGAAAMFYVAKIIPSYSLSSREVASFIKVWVSTGYDTLEHRVAGSHYKTEILSNKQYFSCWLGAEIEIFSMNHMHRTYLATGSFE